jgi:phenylalanine-4-hydroxylase
MFQLPPNLSKYIVEQNYEKYTPVDQACWRYILRQLRSFLSSRAHECYLRGLEKTGISVERIPKISEISAKLQEFGWRALPVSGFIPPAAFMELQAMGVLPIASDMRSLEHLSYTPAPDIVHEAAGHAPILIHPEFADYLKKYALIAKKAIISREDLDLYEAIRELSDLKENPQSSSEKISQAQSRLDHLSKNMSHVSEAGELSRMNWWTAEYGLIGDLSSPKIFGAGLLSSVGESKWCLSDRVKKIPLSIDCIKQSYDITEPQPQLYVASSFAHLTEVLEQMADLMAFRRGGKDGLQKAILAETVNTAELSSGIQISGRISELLEDSSRDICYLRTQGPTQLCYGDSEIPWHSQKTHSQGFGTPVGYLQNSKKCLSLWTDSELSRHGIIIGKKVSLEYSSGVLVEGVLKNFSRENDRIILLSFEDCRVSLRGETLFDPSWGAYDLAVGCQVRSVFGGPADRVRYGGLEDFVAKQIPPTQYSIREKKLHSLYQRVREAREMKIQSSDLESVLNAIFQDIIRDYSEDWLLNLEIYELALAYFATSDLSLRVRKYLDQMSVKFPDKRPVIEDGLTLANKL